MAKLNIFKIDERKKDSFLNRIYEEGQLFNKIIFYNDQEYSISLQTNLDMVDVSLSWQWVLNEFTERSVQLNKFPKAFLFTEINGNLYVATFGTAYNFVEKYCDKNFAFNFARKFDYKKIKSTSQTNPNANKNKVINSYIDNEYFDYDSGSAFIKIKAKLKLQENFDLFNENIEIGTSVKLSIEQESLEKLIQVLLFIETKLEEQDITSIPLFQLVTNDDDITRYDAILKEKIKNGDYNIAFSDFDIIGTNEVFYSQSTSYEISYGRKYEKHDILDSKTIEDFCNRKSLNINDVFLDIKVKTLDEEGRGQFVGLKEIIDCTIDEESATLIKGQWYKYNSDYINILKESLKDLPCKHICQFDFDKNKYETFIAEKVDCYKNENLDTKSSDEEITKIVKKTWYNEKVYNIIMERDFGYINGDRSLQRIDNNYKFEIDDLQKDDGIYAVKIGNTSAKLCYVVDQIDLAMRCIKNKTIQIPNNIKKVCIVLVLDKKSLYPEGDCDFNIDNLNLLALKNALNNWQKEARLLKFDPELIIGYNK